LVQFLIKLILREPNYQEGQLSEVTNFIVGPEDVVQVRQGENLIVSTGPDIRTNKVAIINMQGIPVDLVPLPSNTWLLQGLLPLNVNVAMSSSGILGTYETILVILEPDQQPNVDNLHLLLDNVRHRRLHHVLLHQ
jgi:hypothetical protein